MEHAYFLVFIVQCGISTKKELYCAFLLFSTAFIQFLSAIHYGLLNCVIDNLIQFHWILAASPRCCRLEKCRPPLLTNS